MVHLNLNYEVRSTKQTQMTKKENPKQYDLEGRTFEFAKSVRTLVKKLTKTIGNIEDGNQVIRSSGSVGV